MSGGDRGCCFGVVVIRVLVLVGKWSLYCVAVGGGGGSGIAAAVVVAVATVVLVLVAEMLFWLC